MTGISISALLFYYGLFLIICGITSVIFIGWKAKTALASGGLSGTLAIIIGHYISQDVSMARVGGVILTLGLLIVFSWRSTKTLHKLLSLVPDRHPDVNGKAIAFLIISLMAVTSLFTLLLQLITW